MVTYLLHVVASILGAVVLSEHITAPALPGIALILTGIALARKTQTIAPLSRLPNQKPIRSLPAVAAMKTYGALDTRIPRPS